jgi:hypothetical protein
MHSPNLSPEVIQMLVASVTNSGTVQIREIEAERLLNAIARAQSGTPTGISIEPNVVEQ